MVALPDSDLLGRGFNILGDYSTGSMMPRIFERPTGTDRQVTHSDVTYDVPCGVEAVQGQGGQNSSLSSSSMVFESRKEVQDHFAAKVGVKGTYGGFSGAIEGAFGSDSSTDESCWYAVLETQLDLFQLSLVTPAASASFLADENVKAMMDAEFDSSSPEVFFRVFRTYGTHVVTRVTIGAKIDYNATVSKSIATDKQSVAAKLNLEYKAVVGEASTNASADWSKLTNTWVNSRQVHIAVTGGDESIMALATEPQFNQNFNDLYKAWAETINANPKMIAFQVTPLSQIPGISSRAAAAIDQAIEAYTDNGIYVDATITPGSLSGTVQVSGRMVDQDSYPGRSGGAQLVIIRADDRFRTPVFNNTIYGAQGTWHSGTDQQTSDALWKKLFDGVESLPVTDYICALTVFNWHATNYPTGRPLQWLKRWGASLEKWQERATVSAAGYVAYAFIGSSSTAPNQGLEQIDWDRGHGTAFASVMAPLIPRPGGGLALAQVS